MSEQASFENTVGKHNIETPHNGTHAGAPTNAYPPAQHGQAIPGSPQGLPFGSQPAPKRVTIWNAKKAAEELQRQNAQLTEANFEIGRQNAFFRQSLLRYEAMSLPQLNAEVDYLAAQRNQLRSQLENLESQYRQQTVKLKADFDALSDSIARERSRLEAELLDVRHAVKAQSISLYEYQHPAEDSAALAAELAEVRAAAKKMIREKETYTVTSNFTYNDSLAKGRKLTSDMAKTMLAAYNSEVENAVKSLRAGGYETGKNRVERVLNRITKNGAMVNLEINPRFHSLRLRELELADRHLQAVKQEREAERERKAELREQQKAEAELKKERERLEKERKHYLTVLQALRDRGDEAEAAVIESKLSSVDRAINDVDYRSANIRAGYVYVISNIGTMGSRMVKIGMTRRLEPMDRVRELGDASVPFPFDVHALFFADDAVSIEAMLHREFAEQRVNKVNRRREFFYCTPDEVLGKLKSEGVSIVEYVLEPDAEQYRLSQTN